MEDFVEWYVRVFIEKSHVHDRYLSHVRNEYYLADSHLIISS